MSDLLKLPTFPWPWWISLCLTISWHVVTVCELDRLGRELLFKKLFQGRCVSRHRSLTVTAVSSPFIVITWTHFYMYLHSFLRPFKDATSTWVFNSFPPVCLGFLCIFLALFPKTTLLRQEPAIDRLVQENDSFFADNPVQALTISIRSQMIKAPFPLVSSPRDCLTKFSKQFPWFWLRTNFIYLFLCFRDLFKISSIRALYRILFLAPKILRKTSLKEHFHSAKGTFCHSLV